MNDIVRRIRGRVDYAPLQVERLLSEAADRIEALEAGRMGMSPLEQTVATNIKHLKDRIEALEAALKLSDEALDQMLIWMPSGFAPQSQANAMRLAYEARKVARAALAEGQDK